MQLISMHIFCALAILMDYFFNACTRKTYIQNFLMLASVPIYNWSVYESWFDVQT